MSRSSRRSRGSRGSRRSSRGSRGSGRSSGRGSRRSSRGSRRSRRSTRVSKRRTSESSLPSSRIITKKSDSLRNKLRDKALELKWKKKTERVWYDPDKPENMINLDSRYLVKVLDIPTRENYAKMTPEKKYKHGGINVRAQRRK